MNFNNSLQWFLQSFLPLLVEWIIRYSGQYKQPKLLSNAFSSEKCSGELRRRLFSYEFYIYLCANMLWYIRSFTAFVRVLFIYICIFYDTFLVSQLLIEFYMCIHIHICIYIYIRYFTAFVLVFVQTVQSTLI